MWWMLAAALAAPPADLDVNDVEIWDTAWNPLFDGPPGCWEIVGRASYDWNFGRMGSVQGDAVFVGRLEDNIWQDFHVRSLGEEISERFDPSTRKYPHGERHFAPMVGKRVSDYDEISGDVATSTLLDAVFDELGTGVNYSSSDWDDDANAVTLHRTIPLGETRAEAQMDVWFPEGGTLPTYARIHFPDSFSPPKIPMARVRNADARLRGRVYGGLVFPEVETFSFEAGFLGFRVRGAQTLRYETFRPCGGATEKEAAPILPE